MILWVKISVKCIALLQSLKQLEMWQHFSVVKIVVWFEEILCTILDNSGDDDVGKLSLICYKQHCK